MTKTSKSVKAATPEPFTDAAQRLGEALADVFTHPNCPANVREAISEFDVSVFNHCPDVDIALRHSFPHRLAGMLERRA